MPGLLVAGAVWRVPDLTMPALVSPACFDLSPTCVTGSGTINDVARPHVLAAQPTGYQLRVHSSWSIQIFTHKFLPYEPTLSDLFSLSSPTHCTGAIYVCFPDLLQPSMHRLHPMRCYTLWSVTLTLRSLPAFTDQCGISTYATPALLPQMSVLAPILTNQISKCSTITTWLPSLEYFNLVCPLPSEEVAHPEHTLGGWFEVHRQ
jgi:hypothetical protein